jgi:hypothetical protein
MERLGGLASQSDWVGWVGYFDVEVGRDTVTPTHRSTKERMRYGW